MEDSPLQYDDIVFNAKPDAVPYNYRISYKVTQLCLIMALVKSDQLLDFAQTILDSKNKKEK